MVRAKEVSRRVPATRPRPLAPSGMREEGMWSDAEREDGMWSDAERATDIFKRSRRPLLLSFFLFLPHATTCLSPFSNRSILPQLLFLVLSRPPPRAALVLSDPVLGHRRAPLLSCPVFSRRRAPTSSLSHYPKPCRPGRYTLLREPLFG